MGSTTIGSPLPAAASLGSSGAVDSSRGSASRGWVSVGSSLEARNDPPRRLREYRDELCRLDLLLPADERRDDDDFLEALPPFALFPLA
jgi:hypothetical protein